MPTNETGTQQQSTIPADPNQAKVTLTINFDSQERFSATLNPGSVAFSHEDIASIFLSADVMPRVGTYVFEMSVSDGLRITFPESMLDEEREALKRFLTRDLHGLLEDLIDGYKRFPTQASLRTIATRVVKTVVSGARTRNGMDIKPVPDVAQIVMKGGCTFCDFEGGMLASLLEDLLDRSGDGAAQMEFTQVEGVKFRVVAVDGVPLLIVGYLSHGPFIDFLHTALIQRLRATIAQVAPEIITGLLAHNELRRRALNVFDDSLALTYQIDVNEVCAQADELERKMHSPSTSTHPPREGDEVKLF